MLGDKDTCDFFRMFLSSQFCENIKSAILNSCKPILEDEMPKEFKNYKRIMIQSNELCDMPDSEYADFLS